MQHSISANIADIFGRRFFPGTLCFENSKIISVKEEKEKKYDDYLLPGLIDSHVHIESSMLVPSEFARIAAIHGTVAAVADPHEIANVLGKAGIYFMIENAAATPFKFYFGASSCVPATPFESSGASLAPSDIRELLSDPNILFLSEMMNFPGVINEFPDVTEKLAIARKLGKPMDGHAPGLRGADLVKYVKAGISTDHETYKYNEAVEKIGLGMNIIIREGSAAKNFDELHPLISEFPRMCMFCSDDKHPDDLLAGHINKLIIRALAKGHDIFDILQAAALNPVRHYGLDSGLLREGDSADMILIDNINDFNILETYICGIKAAEKGKPMLRQVPVSPVNKFDTLPKSPDEFRILSGNPKVRIIEVIENQIITGEIIDTVPVSGGCLIPDIERDILKISVVSRYENKPPATAFVKNFGLRKGAIAASIAHDSHNIIAVGTSDEAIAASVNAIILAKGGIAVFDGNKINLLPLPVAGLMSDEDAYTVARKYTELDSIAKSLGSKLQSPFMTLSFMALLVIPSLKLGDKGLFDGTKFEFTGLNYG